MTDRGLNLVSGSWIPVRRRSGESLRIAPHEITSKPTDPIVSLAFPRPDFNANLIQFLVGLLQTAVGLYETPWNIVDGDDWRRLYREPADPGQLQEALGPLQEHFYLDGDGPRYLQDLELGESTPRTKRIDVDQLLLESPGENTLKQGKDHFVPKGRIRRLCGPCTAAALTGLQSYAAKGGSGHRVGLRGGGPLTTLIRDRRSLWHTLWANVLPRDEMPTGNASLVGIEHVLPWTAPTRTSSDKTKTHFLDVHPLQTYWSFPRRIRLESKPAEGGETCDVCLDPADRFYTSMLRAPHGTYYGDGFIHPLSPYSVPRDSKESPSAIKGGSKLLYYRNLLGCLYDDDQKKLSRNPARVVSRFLKRRFDEDVQLWAFGFDAPNAKTRAWCEAAFPLIHVDAERLELFIGQVAALTRSAEKALDSLFTAESEIISRRKVSKAKRPKTEALAHRFWQSTEVTFYQSLHRIAAEIDDPEALQEVRSKWLESLRATCVRLFGDFATPSLLRAIEPGQVYRAKNRLEKNLRSLRKELDLPKRDSRS